MTGFLSQLIGSGAAEAALLHLFHYGETYGRAIATDMGISLQPVQSQLDSLEESGVLVSKAVGRTRLYTWNPKNPFTEPLQQMVKIQYESIPCQRRQELFKPRRRPRKKGQVRNRVVIKPKTRGPLLWPRLAAHNIPKRRHCTEPAEA